MIPPLDIFRIDLNGNLIWLEPAQDMDSAKVRLRILGAVVPGKYIVVSQKTGNRTVFSLDEDGRFA